jgi:predicted ATPase
MIQFSVVPRGGNIPSVGRSIAYLQIDHWNDYSYVTMFQVTLFDDDAVKHELGNVKIGFRGQTAATSTHSTLGDAFTTLAPGYFSVGIDVDYYLKLSREVSDDSRHEYLNALCDIAADQRNLDIALDEEVFQTSLLRSLNVNTVIDQYRRVVNGGVPLTDYAFRFTQDASDQLAPFELSFDIKANSKPTTNIHAIIGRNGAGKTTILNNMTRSITDESHADSRFETRSWSTYKKIGRDYFSGLISVSFSAFDPFNPPEEQADPSRGTCYFYVGLKSIADDSEASLKSQNDLTDEFIAALGQCLSEKSRRSRWLEAIQNLESDDNFAEMNLAQLLELRGDARAKTGRSLLRRMSSGHAIVLLTITKLVARVDEKTLVLFDEPESHLHPPLLSALIRCISKLLSDRNAIAIIATHSPVVLQEIPKSCVWKITRSGLSAVWQRPEVETFGENVGVLTREVFSLEVTKSGFNELLLAEAARATSYEEAIAAFNGQLGMEGRAILQSIMHRVRD